MSREPRREPRTEAGRRLFSRFWGTPATDAHRISQIVAFLGHDIADIEDEAADRPLDAAWSVVLSLARETLTMHDQVEAAGWVVATIPHEAEVRAILATATRLSEQVALSSSGEDR